ncbi:hypothetical protein E4T56_gene20974 [Termitomyces sp. T112]|nr:hypothetical protein E4T56_gene20974 [Termitomyces sp. T112]
MTPGPPHCIADAPPTTSPIVPSPAATLEAELRTPVSTRPELTQMPQRHRLRGPNAPAPSLNPENELSITNGGTGGNSRRIPVRPEAASLANQSSLHLAAFSSAHNASPSGTRPRPSASPVGCPSICVRCSRKPHTSNARSIATHTNVFLSRSIASFSIHATSRSSLACRSSPSRTANDVVKASTCLQRKTSVIEGIGMGGLNNRSEGTPGVGEKRRDSGGPTDGSHPRGLLLGPAPKGGEAQCFPRITAKDAPFSRPPCKSPAFPADCPMLPSFGNAGRNLVRFGTPGKSTTTTMDNSTKTPAAPTLKLLPSTVIHHHLIEISGGDYWNAGGRHDEIWEIPGTTPAVPDLRHPSSTQHPGSSDPFQSITTTSGQPAFPNDPNNVSAQPDPRSQPTPAHSIKLCQAPPPQLTYPKVLR